MPTPEEILTRARTIAVVGFSADPSKPAHTAPMALVRQGWEVIPVNPTLGEEVAGLRAYATLADVPVHVDVVDVFRRAEFTPEVAREAAAIGAGALWLQLGIVSSQARAIAEAAGLDYVEDLCAGALAARRDLHPAATG